MKREKSILCALLILNATMLVAGAFWVNNDAYHRGKDVWNMYDPWPRGNELAIIDYFPPSLFDYSSGVFFILCAAVSIFAYVNSRKITKDRADLLKAICHDIWAPIMRVFVGIGAALLIARYVMEQFDHLAFISQIQIDENDGPLYFIKMDTILLSSLCCGIISLIWLAITLRCNRSKENTQPPGIHST